MTLGEKIKLKREAMRLTQVKLAMLVGVENNTISRWERGALIPKSEYLAKLASALGTSTDYLLGESPEHVTSSTSTSGVNSMAVISGPGQLDKTQIKQQVPLC